MSFSTKGKITPDKLKFISTLFIGIFIITSVCFFNNIAMKKIMDDSDKRYYNNCVRVLQGYSEGVHYYLENYRTSLMSIYNEDLFKKGDMTEIQKWIIQNIKFLHKDFCTVFYVDSNFTGYFSQGNIIDLKGKSYLNPENFSGKDYYVSDLCTSELTEYPIFFIEMPYFDENHNIKGILCASIKISRLLEIAEKIKIGTDGVVMMVDRTGKTLVHPEPSIIGTVFVPKSEKYKNITADKTALEEDGYTETENYLGEPIDLFHAKVKNCGWTISVSFRKKFRNEIWRGLYKIKIFILVLSIGSLLVLIFLENLVADYFYRNQLILAVYDPLTRLWTRQKFESEAEKMLRRDPKSKYMLIETDIRGFKFINQNYSEEAADKIICFFSGLLNECVRQFNGIIGHGYADHFYILIKISTLKNAMNEFKGQTYLISEQIKEFKIPFFPKFGVTFTNPSYHPNLTIKELIGQASFAKSTIKDNMVTPYAIYNARILDRVNEERTLEHNMKKALENQEFFVMYQPKILLENDTIVGAEALVRWKNPALGMIYPDKFIPLFERNNFIVKLDFYVYNKVFKFLDSQIKAGKSVVPISVNMSRNHDKPEKFMFEFLRLFKKYNIPPSLIQVEILERSVMGRETLCEITEALHKEGFSVAMDDFGSGESSLSMLTKVPIDVLKFDRVFLLSSTNENGSIEEKSASFIRSLIDLSKNLEKETVFEGVETEQQRDFLRSINCDQVQGYFYSRPLMEDDFVAFIQEHINA